MTTQSFQFESPLVLLLLFLLPILFYFKWLMRGNAAIQYSSNQLLTNLPLSLKSRLSFIPLVLQLLALVFLVVALARPQWGSKITESTTEGIDILLTIDTSGSMKALDFELDGNSINRLEVVKSVVDDFISKRQFDRIGMVIFGEEAYTQTPLTRDQETIRFFLKWIRTGIVGDGTAIGNGLATAVKRLTKQKTKSKIIILLTDGRNNTGTISPETAAQIAKEKGIKIYTIGVGREGAVPFPEETPFGTRIVYAKLELDEQTLKNIAAMTGGQYFKASDTEALKKIYTTIDQLEKTKIKVKEYHEVRELFFPFLLQGLALMILSILLSETYFMKIP